MQNCYIPLRRSFLQNLLQSSRYKKFYKHLVLIFHIFILGHIWYIFWTVNLVKHTFISFVNRKNKGKYFPTDKKDQVP